MADDQVPSRPQPLSAQASPAIQSARAATSLAVGPKGAISNGQVEANGQAAVAVPLRSRLLNLGAQFAFGLAVALFLFVGLWTLGMPVRMAGVAAVLLALVASSFTRSPGALAAAQGGPGRQAATAGQRPAVGEQWSRSRRNRRLRRRAGAAAEVLRRRGFRHSYRLDGRDPLRPSEDGGMPKLQARLPRQLQQRGRSAGGGHSADHRLHLPQLPPDSPPGEPQARGPRAAQRRLATGRQRLPRNPRPGFE